MNKILMALFVSACMLIGSSFAQNPPADTPDAAPVVIKSTRHYSQINKAMRKLRGAKQDLEKATHDYGGHKLKALQAINHALMELNAALNYAKTE